MKISYCIIAILFVATSMMGCKKTDELVDFTEEDEMLLGEKLATALLELPDFTPIPTEGNSIAYGYANARLQEIIASEAILKSENFTWTITLFEDEQRQAFAFPGGYVYVSTGMIFYLENEDQFSGLLSHLVAHINQSHISERLFFKYGINGLKSIAQSGSQEQLHQIIEDLNLNGTYLQFSRAHELVIDTLTVTLLSGSGQSCEASGLFMDRALRIQPEQLSSLLNAHRMDTIRVDAIGEYATTFGCEVQVDSESAIRFRSFRNSLP